MDQNSKTNILNNNKDKIQFTIGNSYISEIEKNSDEDSLSEVKE